MALTPATMAEALWIGTAGGKNHFNIGLGQGTSGGGGNHTDFPQSQIEDGFSDANKFFLNASSNPVFRINASAGTTSTNTIHPRSELRELLADGTTQAAWDGRSGKHTMKGRSRIITVTSNRPWVCFFQCHGSTGSPNTSDLFRVQTEGANGTSTNLSLVCRYTKPGQDEVRVVLRTGYNVNDWVTWETWIGGDTAADNGRLRIWLDGVLVLDVGGMGQILCYWKTGCYLQDSVGEGASTSDWGAVEMQKGSLQVWHTGYPAPTTPIFTGPDDGLGGAVDTVPPTIPNNVAAIRGNTQATLVWDASTDNVGVTGYKVRRSAGGAAGTVGKTDDSPSSSASSVDKIFLSPVTPTVTGTVTTGHSRAWLSAAGTSNTKIVIYADSAGAPGALLAVSDQLAITATTEGVRNYTFSGGNQIALTAGVDYWVGLMFSDPGTPSINVSRDVNANGRVELSGFTYPTAPNPAGTATPFSGPIDVWVETGGTTLVASPTTTTYTDTGLTNGVQYGYTVSAVDAAGNESAQSSQVLVTPGAPDTTPPTVPTGLVATPGDRRVSLTWTASTDTDTGMRGYNVYRGGVLVASPTGTSYTDTELTNGTSYSYTVSAVDNSFNESAQTSPSGATPSAPSIGGVPFLTRELGASGAIGVEVAFGADLSADPSTWTWTDVTRDVRVRDGISTSLGRNDESGTSNPATLTLVLDNQRGDYSLGGRSRWWPYVRRNTPVRVRIDPSDGGGGRVLFWGGADGWTPGWDSLTGKIAVVTLSASGTLRRLGQGNAPVQSAFRRAMTSTASVVSYWPMEEGEAAAYAPALRGGGDMTLEGQPDWAEDSTFYCSAPLPKFNAARATADPAPYTSTGQTQIRWLMLLPENGPTAGANLLSVFTTGSIARWDILYAAGPAITVNKIRSDGSLHSSNTYGFSINGAPGRMSLELTQSGADIAWRLGFTSAKVGTTAGYVADTITGQTVGTVSLLQFGANQQLGDTVLGHLTLETAITSLFTANDALIAFQGEYASAGGANPFVSRLERLAWENSVPMTRYTSGFVVPDDLGPFDTMGPQLVAPLLDLLREAEAADQGQLWDGRSQGLSYTTRRRREEGISKLSINASELVDGFAPTDDDQRTRNKIEVKRTFGITTQYEDTISTDAIGIYDDSITVNAGRDQDMIQQAQWRVSLGTVDGYRYPSVTVDLRNTPRLKAAVLDLVPGERIDITGLDTTLAGFTSPSVSLIVEGISHEIGATSWQVTFTCSLFEPWAVGRVAADTGDTSDLVMRLDTDGSQLATGASVGATSLSVTSSGALWTTFSDDYPLWLLVGGLPVLATACSGSSNPQTFSISPLPVSLTSGDPVQLWQSRRVGMG